jgi:hypothetical protein
MNDKSSYLPSRRIINGWHSMQAFFFCFGLYLICSVIILQKSFSQKAGAIDIHRF